MLDESAATMIARLIQKRVLSPKAGFGIARAMASQAFRTGSGIDLCAGRVWRGRVRRRALARRSPCFRPSLPGGLKPLHQAFPGLLIEIAQTSASPLLPSSISVCRVWENCGTGTTFLCVVCVKTVSERHCYTLRALCAEFSPKAAELASPARKHKPVSTAEPRRAKSGYRKVSASFQKPDTFENEQPW